MTAEQWVRTSKASHQSLSIATLYGNSSEYVFDVDVHVFDEEYRFDVVLRRTPRPNVFTVAVLNAYSCTAHSLDQ